MSTCNPTYSVYRMVKGEPMWVTMFTPETGEPMLSSNRDQAHQYGIPQVAQYAAENANRLLPERSLQLFHHIPNIQPV